MRLSVGCVCHFGLMFYKSPKVDRCRMVQSIGVQFQAFWNSRTSKKTSLGARKLLLFSSYHNIKRKKKHVDIQNPA